MIPFMPTARDQGCGSDREILLFESLRLCNQIGHVHDRVRRIHASNCSRTCFDPPSLLPVVVLMKGLGEAGQQKENVSLIDGRLSFDQRKPVAEVLFRGRAFAPARAWWQCALPRSPGPRRWSA